MIVTILGAVSGGPIYVDVEVHSGWRQHARVAAERRTAEFEGIGEGVGIGSTTFVVGANEMPNHPGGVQIEVTCLHQKNNSGPFVESAMRFMVEDIEGSPSYYCMVSADDGLPDLDFNDCQVKIHWHRADHPTARASAK